MRKLLTLAIIFFMSVALFAQTNESRIEKYGRLAQSYFDSNDYDNAILYWGKKLDLQK